jgi:shikimate dehydrogenase
MIIHPMSGSTRIYLKLGLIGYPVSHSLSPIIHQAALKEKNMKGEYNLYAIPPLPEGKPALEEMLKRLHDGQISGLNVTIPHKQSVLPYLDELTDSSLAIGAVNTILMK